MPRPALGSSAKGTVASTRVTAEEARMLEAAYGSKAKALRAFINAFKDAQREAAK